VKSCAIIIYLRDQGVEGASDRLIDFVDALVSSVRPDHTEAVAGHIGSILQTVIEEVETLDQDLLDLFLAPLIPSAKADNPAAYNLCQSVLRRCELAIQGPINAFVNRSLVGSMGELGPMGSGEESNLSEHIYAIIYELHKVHSGLLLRILPNVCVQLQADEAEVRLKAVKLLGRLFASPHADYGVEYNRNFKDFLGRFVDVAEDVRLEMIECGYMIMKNKEDLRALVSDCMCKRLRDGESAVRFASLGRLLDIAYEYPTYLSVETFRDMLERVKDKKPNVRKVALIGLSKVFFKHISVRALSFHNLGEGDAGSVPVEYVYGEEGEERAREVADSLGISADIWTRLSIVPGYIINAWGYPDPENKHLVTQLIQEQILPKPPKNLSKEASGGQSEASKNITSSSSSLSVISETDSGKEVLEWESKRATLLLRIFGTLDSTQRQCLGAIMAFKSKIRVELEQFTNKWTSILSGQSKTNVALQMHRAGFRLLENFPANLAALEKKLATSPVSLERLVQSKDKILVRLLKSATAPVPFSRISARSSSAVEASESDYPYSHSCIARACMQRDDLRRRLDSKSPLGGYMARLFDTSAIHMLANPYTASCLLYHMTAVAKIPEEFDEREESSGRVREMKDTSDLLMLLAKHFPMIFAGSAPDLEAWLMAICEDTRDNRRPSSSSATSKYRRSTTTRVTRSEARNRALEQFTRVLKYAAKNLCDTNENTSGDADHNRNTTRNLCAALLKYAKEYNDPLACEMLAQGVCTIVRGGHTYADIVPESALSSSRLCDAFGVTSALNILSKTNRMSLSSPLERVACDLHVFASLLSAYGESARELSGPFDRLNKFLKEQIFSPESSLHERSSDCSQDPNDDFYLLTLVGAMKVYSELAFKSAIRESMVSGVSPFTQRQGALPEEESDDESFSDHEQKPMSQRFPEYAVPILSLVFECICSYGSKFSGIAIPGTSRHVLLRETAAVCLIRMLKIKSVGKGINTAEWQALAWTLLDENDTCRRRILQSLSIMIQTHCVHPRFLALPCIVASDESLQGMAEQALTFAMKRLRATSMELRSRAISLPDLSSEEGQRLQQMAEDNTPECVVPYLIHLLSHHPDFPSSPTLSAEGDSERMRNVLRCVKMLYHILLTALGKDNDNLSYLLKQANMIRFYRDRLDKYNIGLRFVTKLATNVLKGYIRTQEDAQPFLGDINLPMDLYELDDGEGEDIDELDVKRAIQMANRAEAGASHRAKVMAKKSPVKKQAPTASREIKELKGVKAAAVASEKPTKKRKARTKPEKSAPAPRPPRSSSRPQRRSVSTAVNYADTRESDDEAEMDEIEELLSTSQSTSGRGSESGHRKRFPSSRVEGRHSSSSMQSGVSDSPFDFDSVNFSEESTSSSFMAKKRKLSGGWSSILASDDEAEQNNETSSSYVEETDKSSASKRKRAATSKPLKNLVNKDNSKSAKVKGRQSTNPSSVATSERASSKCSKSLSPLEKAQENTTELKALRPVKNGERPSRKSTRSSVKGNGATDSESDYFEATTTVLSERRTREKTVHSYDSATQEQSVRRSTRRKV